MRPAFFISLLPANLRSHPLLFFRTSKFWMDSSAAGNVVKCGSYLFASVVPIYRVKQKAVKISLSSEVLKKSPSAPGRGASDFRLTRNQVMKIKSYPPLSGRHPSRRVCPIPWRLPQSATSDLFVIRGGV